MISFLVLEEKLSVFLFFSDRTFQPRYLVGEKADFSHKSTKNEKNSELFRLSQAG